MVQSVCGLLVYWVHIVSGCILGELFVWFNPTSPTSGSISLTPYYSQLMVGFLWFSLVELDVNEKMKSVIHVALQPFFQLRSASLLLQIMKPAQN